MQAAMSSCLQGWADSLPQPPAPGLSSLQCLGPGCCRPLQRLTLPSFQLFQRTHPSLLPLSPTQDKMAVWAQQNALMAAITSSPCPEMAAATFHTSWAAQMAAAGDFVMQRPPVCVGEDRQPAGLPGRSSCLLLSWIAYSCRLVLCLLAPNALPPNTPLQVATDERCRTPAPLTACPSPAPPLTPSRRRPACR
jgi:hypothetical protein